MKTFLLTCLRVLLFGSLAPAGVIVTPSGVLVNGVIEGDGREPIFRGNTIDYWTFEVTSQGPVRLIATNVGNSFFLAEGVVLEDNTFDIVGVPYRIFSTSPTPQLSYILDPGVYVVQVAGVSYRDGDLSDTFVPANRVGGGFLASPYSFALEGSFTPLDFMEGNLDGTFSVTHVREPSTTALLCLAAAAMVGVSRKRRMGKGGLPH